MASDADNRQQSAQLQPFRIFLASPGDVQDERRLAKKVIDQISHEVSFRDRLDIKVVSWDQPGEAVAMDAGLTPQEAIAQGLPKPSECDLVVVILWARMGTPLPSDYEKADGSPYLSGTEWEYENAMAAESGPERPAVWVPAFPCADTPTRPGVPADLAPPWRFRIPTRCRIDTGCHQLSRNR